MPADPKTTAAAMCVGCGLTFRRQAGDCPKCFPQREPDVIRRSTHVAPSVPAAASGHLFTTNRQAMSQQYNAAWAPWREARKPQEALNARIINRIVQERANEQ